MRMLPVDSTAFSALAYDESRGRLQIEFCSGAVYQYFNVPEMVYQALLAAGSKGRYFNDAIRGRFLYRLLQHSGAVRANAQVLVGCDR